MAEQVRTAAFVPVKTLNAMPEFQAPAPGNPAMGIRDRLDPSLVPTASEQRRNLAAICGKISLMERH